MRNNRRAGHNLERFEARALRESGLFPYAVTCRVESRSRDDAKVDIMNADENTNGRMEYNFQCKQSRSHIKYHLLMKMLPDIRGIMNVIMHQYTIPSITNKFMVKGTYAILSREDFYQMMRLRRGYEILLPYVNRLPVDTQREIEQKLIAIGL